MRFAPRRPRVVLMGLTLGGLVCVTAACSPTASTVVPSAGSDASASNTPADVGRDSSTRTEDAAVGRGDAAASTREDAGGISVGQLDSGLETEVDAAGSQNSFIDGGPVDADARGSDAALGTAEAGAFAEAGAELDCGGTAPRYASGLNAVGKNGVRVTLVDATPDPPVPGLNVLVLRLEDMEGNTLNGAQVSVTEYMPQHRHGSPSEPVSEQLENGSYEVSGVEFTMPGYWELTIEIATGELEDTVRLDLCI